LKKPSKPIIDNKSSFKKFELPPVGSTASKTLTISNLCTLAQRDIELSVIDY